MNSQSTTCHSSVIKNWLNTGLLILFILVPHGLAFANGTERSPLDPIDTSSPRSTLAGFLDFTDESFKLGISHLEAYMESDRLYLSREDLETFKTSIGRLISAERALDLSELPPATISESSRRLTVLLRLILKHIDLPPLDAVPDAEEMKKSDFKRWTIPNTEIRIVRVETGPRAGEYLFSPDTVARLPEFYEKLKDLPVNSDQKFHWHQMLTNYPTGVAMLFASIIPSRWFFSIPDWMVDIRFLDQPLWRCLAVIVLLYLGYRVVRRGFHFSKKIMENHPDPSNQWPSLIGPISLVLVAPLCAKLLDQVLRVTGIMQQILTLPLWGLFFLALAWTIWVAGGALAETLINIDKLRSTSIDSQLIRLITRLITLILAISVLLAGADQIGLPAYSVVAGVGIGGLAIALGAQQSLANLLGSMIIMFEKPFAIGHAIKAQGVEGTVESVGFRSTRVRSHDNALVTIPSSQMVSGVIENMQEVGNQNYRVSVALKLANDTPPLKIRTILTEISDILVNNPEVQKDGIEVALSNIEAGQAVINVRFRLKPGEPGQVIKAKEAILLSLLEVGEKLGLRFN